MDDPSARDQLVQLLDEASAETRYGAYRALRSMNGLDPLVRGENLGDAFSYHLLDTKGPAMVHVARSRRAEIVIFGAEERLQTPVILDAGKYIQVNGTTADKVEVVKILPGEPERRQEVTARLDDVIRAIVEVGGSYPDVVQALTQAKATGSLECRFEVDALPDWGRRYQRSELADFKPKRSTETGSAEGVDPQVMADAAEIHLTQTGRADVSEVGAGVDREEQRSRGVFSVPDRRWSWPPRIGRMWSPQGE
jgi:hypothetical protein